MPGRSTTQADRYLFRELEDTIKKPKGKYHVVFIDYEKAFDMLNREKLRQKITDMIGKSHPLVKLIEYILAYNFVETDDGITTARIIKQTNRIL